MDNGNDDNGMLKMTEVKVTMVLLLKITVVKEGERWSWSGNGDLPVTFIQDLSQERLFWVGGAVGSLIIDSLRPIMSFLRAVFRVLFNSIDV